MDNFDKLKKIQSELLMVITYRILYGDTNLSERVDDKVSALKQAVGENIRCNDLSAEQLESLGFVKWDDSEDPVLWLMPGYYYPFLDLDMHVVTISGNMKLLRDMDTDTRFGVLACGVYA